MKPLEGITVLDFSQFLSAPSATMRLADLGARVIKVERPDSGDICRTLYVSNLKIEEDSSLFHSINRNKDGVSLDLKNPDCREDLENLLSLADVMVVNFRGKASGVRLYLRQRRSPSDRLRRDHRIRNRRPLELQAGTGPAGPVLIGPGLA